MASSPTRVVHRVRCRNKDDKSMWVDVKVVDAITVIAPNGTSMLLWVVANDSIPYILDQTGGGNGKGDASECTRASHMELVSQPDDPKQKFYVEVLDAVAFKPPIKHVSEISGKGMEDNERLGGRPKPADFGKGAYALIVPEGASSKLIVDRTGLGLSSGAEGSASRVGHVLIATEKGNTDDKTDGIKEAGDSVPPKKLNWAAVLRPDGVNFRVPNGNIMLFLPRGVQDELDVTKMTKDPLTGEPCPPDNRDPNIYVTFPKKSGDPNGPTVGSNVHIATRKDKGGRDKSGPIDQGPLWWIERVSPGFRPWFWYAKVQEPKAFSYFGNPGRLGSWAWRGFVLWNNYPVIWILSRNLPLIGMGSFGSPSLDACARFGNWDFAGPPVPSEPVGIPPRPSSGFFPPLTALAFEGEFLLTTEEQTTYAPFGLLQMTFPPLGQFPDAVPYGNHLSGNDGSELWSGRPNIWQLTGKQQPPRSDPTKMWNPFLNPYTPPSTKDAEACAKTFRDLWNDAANGHNEYIAGYAPGGKQSVYTTPPGWGYAVPYFSPTSGGLKYYGAFQGGIPYGVATSVGLPLVDFIPATGYTIDVDQLDQKIWDTTKLELYNNPLNWFLPFLLPPQLWPPTP